ncbi:YciI family protein [Pseudaminobacter soli (ex Li et al. 2025)]|uniref:YCII-related domain-containing protein n=1 Tax=Pseudaminobacter soli (ex Li et al. 2025) TaxID=1295366 RepID=A0A2P7SD60_9HYPH|nr:YciI family protein [Mesorhizobium soli]PSJ60429.1 hypothetical protein C7I85_13510 [Mesorhizobium soli]
MRYMLLIYANEAAVQGNPDKVKDVSPAYIAYTNAMRDAGILLGGEPLQPTAYATTVRSRSGKTEVLEGPYAETREQLAGYYMIEAPDLDAAIGWAARCPGAENGTIEVRPLWEMRAS